MQEQTATITGMGRRTKPPFRADHVGSLLRPRRLLQAREQHAAGTLDAAGLRTVEDAAIREIVAKQESAGLQSATDGEACVCDLTAPLGLSQPTVSHHLRILTEAGLLEREKRGPYAYFRLAPGALEQIGSMLAEQPALARAI